MVLGVSPPQFPVDAYVQTQDQSSQRSIAGRSFEDLSNMIPQLIQLYKQQKAQADLQNYMKMLQPGGGAPGVQGPANQANPYQLAALYWNTYPGQQNPYATMLANTLDPLKQAEAAKNQAMAQWFQRRPASPPGDQPSTIYYDPNTQSYSPIPTDGGIPVTVTKRTAPALLRPPNPAAAAGVDVKVQAENVKNRPWWEKFWNPAPQITNPLKKTTRSPHVGQRFQNGTITDVQEVQ